MKQTEHAKLTSLENERTKLLHEYDTAISQAANDTVKTKHGVSCESLSKSCIDRNDRKRINMLCRKEEKRKEEIIAREKRREESW